MGLIVLTGIALAVFGGMLVFQGFQAEHPNRLRIGGVVAILGVSLALLASSFVVVEAGKVGVIFNTIGGLSKRERGEGIQFVVPGLQQMTLMNIRQQAVEFSQDNNDEIPALSAEGLQIVSDVTVRYSIDPKEASAIYETLGTSYETNLIRPQVRSVVRNAVANYKAAEVISSKRVELQKEITDVLTTELASNNIILLDVLIRDIRIPASITQAIEDKQAAEQQIEVENNRREQAKVVAERARIQAQGESDARIIQAQGEAQALELRGEAIRNNPELIQLEVAEKLAPTLQTIMLPSEGNFLLDVGSLTGGSSRQQFSLPNSNP